MDWIPIISTLGGFVIAGISIYLNYKARTSPYREVLYSKQLDIYIELIDTLVDFYLSINKLIKAKSNKEGEKVELLIQKEAAEKGADLAIKYMKGLAVIPPKIAKPILKLVDEASYILSGPFKIDKVKELRNSTKRIYGNIYDTIGTIPLSIETLKLIDKIKS